MPLSAVLIHFVILSKSVALPDIIKIGGLFDVTDQLKHDSSQTRQEIAFKYAVERINLNRDILPRSRLSAQIEKIPPQDSFHASKQVCHLLRSGVAALFGPESGTTSTHIQSICDAMEIPHIETRWDFVVRRDDYSINLYPNPKIISKAYCDLIESFGWKSFTILYQDNQGLVRLQELLKAPTKSDVKIVVRQLSFKDDKNKEILKEIKQAGEIHLVLDCDFDKIPSVLKEAQSVGLMTAYHNYLITNLDLHLVDLEEFKYAGTNLTAFRLVDPGNVEVKNTVKDWNLRDRFPGRSLGGYSILKDPSKAHNSSLKTETALIYDAVYLFAKALHELDQSQNIEIPALSCDGHQTWQHGNSLVNFMKLVEMNGLTGKIKFDQKGQRTDFELDIIELKRDGLTKVGTWTEKRGVNMSRNFTETYTEIVESLQNKTLTITTIMSPPYSMVRRGPERLTGNDAFEGFAIDLIAEIAQILKFNFTLKWVDDGAYGFMNKETGEWNGLMGELLAQKADLAIADLTITYEREQAVDFSMPFMNLGISILYKKPQKKPPDLFSFLSPLSLDVWIYTATAYLGVSILLFILARFSPYEWDNPHPCNDEAEVLVNEFSLCNSMWFTIGSLMQQGSDISPKAISTRMVAGMWWFFTLIMISSYTANLAAFLTVERMESPIESAEDLAKQTKIKYGCLESGSTRAFFRDSKFPTYARMASFMESQKPKVFTTSNADGVKRVLESPGQYAFLMESNSIQYQIERNCELTQIGGLLDSKGYGIAFTPGSPYRIPISSAILQLQEAGRLHVLKNRWWKEKSQTQCNDEQKKSANELSLDNVGGIFVVLLAGMGIACTIAVLEYIWKSKRLEKKINVRHRDLVKKAITQTNTNMFYINRSCGGTNGRVSIKVDHCHNKGSEDYSRGLKSPEYHLVGPGRKLFQKTTSQLQCGDVCDDEQVSDSPPVSLSRSATLHSAGHSVPDITRRQSHCHDLDSDPYGPMSGRNLVSTIQDIGDQLSETDSYVLGGSMSRHSTPRQRHGDTSYHGQHTMSYCDIHCQHDKTRQRRKSRDAFLARDVH